MKFDDNAIRNLYDRSAKAPLFWELDALFGRATENSVYRKRAVAALKLNEESVVLDVACGPGFNFKIIESCLSERGRLVGVDISLGVLKLARKRVEKYGWTNVNLVNESIVEYETRMRFDAVLCAFAMTIIPDYKAALERMFALLKPAGRFAMIGMKKSTWKVFRLFNPLMEWSGQWIGVDWDRDVAGYIQSRCKDVEYEEYFGGWYYILSTTKSSYVGGAKAESILKRC